MELPELPPLPACLVETDLKVNGEWVHEALFVTADMRAYALEAVRAERERIIAMLREFPFEITEPEHVEAMVAAIRAQGSP